MITLRNLATNWASANPTLPKGEFALELDTNKVKLGDGLTPWNSLGYFGSSSWGGITGTLSAQTDLNNVISPITPLTNQTFSGQFNLSTNYEVYYNTYTTNTTVTPTVAATPLVGAVARVVFDAGSSAALTVTNLGTLRAGSDTFTISKLNEILVFSLPEGLEYSIKVLN